MNAVPELRFKRDDGSDFPDWEDATIGGLGKFYYGKSAPKYSLAPDAPTPCVRYGELYSKYDVVISETISRTNVDPKTLKFSEGGEILVPRVGETPTDFAKNCCLLAVPNVAIGEMISVFRTDQNSLFYTYYFRTLVLEFARVVEGASVSNLYYAYLEPIEIGIPHLEEQQKIAAFLGAVDDKIDALRRKHDGLKKFKAGLMQKLFSQELRFKRDDGSDYPDWEEKTVGACTSFLKDGTHGTHVNDPAGDCWLLSAKNLQSGSITVDESDRRINRLEKEKIAKGYKLQAGDILLSIVGTIGRVARFDGREDVAFQRSVAFFRFTEVIPEFAFHYMNSTLFQRELHNRKVVSAQPGIYLGDLGKIPMPQPLPEEQQKIADCLSAADAKIDAVESQIRHMEQFKKGLLQKMFV